MHDIDSAIRFLILTEEQLKALWQDTINRVIQSCKFDISLTMTIFFNSLQIIKLEKLLLVEGIQFTNDLSGYEIINPSQIEDKLKQYEDKVDLCDN